MFYVISMHNCLCILMYIFMWSDFSRPVLVLHISFAVYKLVMVRPRPLSGRCSATIYLTRAVTTARTPQASNGLKCTCTVVAVYPVTSVYHARDSTCHTHSLAFVKFEQGSNTEVYVYSGRGIPRDFRIPCA